MKKKYPNVLFLALVEEGKHVPVFNLAYQSIGPSSKKPAPGMLEINELWGDQRPKDYMIYDSYDSQNNDGVKGTIMVHNQWYDNNRQIPKAEWHKAIAEAGV